MKPQTSFSAMCDKVGSDCKYDKCIITKCICAHPPTGKVKDMSNKVDLFQLFLRRKAKKLGLPHR